MFAQLWAGAKAIAALVNSSWAWLLATAPRVGQGLITFFQSNAPIGKTDALDIVKNLVGAALTALLTFLAGHAALVGNPLFAAILTALAYAGLDIVHRLTGGSLTRYPEPPAQVPPG